MTFLDMNEVKCLADNHTVDPNTLNLIVVPGLVVFLLEVRYSQLEGVEHLGIDMGFIVVCSLTHLILIYYYTTYAT